MIILISPRLRFCILNVEKESPSLEGSTTVFPLRVNDQRIPFASDEKPITTLPPGDVHVKLPEAAHVPQNARAANDMLMIFMFERFEGFERFERFERFEGFERLISFQTGQ